MQQEEIPNTAEYLPICYWTFKSFWIHGTSMFSSYYIILWFFAPKKHCSKFHNRCKYAWILYAYVITTGFLIPYFCHDREEPCTGNVYHQKISSKARSVLGFFESYTEYSSNLVTNRDTVQFTSVCILSSTTYISCRIECYFIGCLKEIYFSHFYQNHDYSLRGFL